MTRGDAIVVSTVIAVDPVTAFTLFTEDVDLWWKRGPRYRFLTSGNDGTLRFEGGKGGRLVETTQDTEFEVGRITTWLPGERLVLKWRVRDFTEGELTEVDVRFEAEGEGTRVTVEHRGWDELAADHPVRHGLEGTAFDAMIGHWWADLLVEVQAHAKKRV